MGAGSALRQREGFLLCAAPIRGEKVRRAPVRGVPGPPSTSTSTRTRTQHTCHHSQHASPGVFASAGRPRDGWASSGRWEVGRTGLARVWFRSGIGPSWGSQWGGA